MIDREVDRLNIVRDRKISETKGLMHFCCKEYSTETGEYTVGYLIEL
jgi:hypothetical protein